MTMTDGVNGLLLLLWAGLGAWWLSRYRQAGGDTPANLMLVMLAGLMMVWNVLQLWRRRVARAARRENRTTARKALHGGGAPSRGD